MSWATYKCPPVQNVAMTSSNPTSKDMGAMDTKRGRKAALFGSVLLVALNRSKIRPVRPDMAR